MQERIVFIGAGAMGGAILRKSLAANVFFAESVQVVVKTETTAQALAEELHVATSIAVPDLTTATLIVLAVKPQILPAVLPYLEQVAANTVIVSVAAGVSLQTLHEAVPQAIWLRAMPNTPLQVGAGMTAISMYDTYDAQHTALPLAMFKAAGEVVVVSEPELDALGAIAGSGPGYMFVILDALTDAGVRIGLQRPLALQAAIQTMYGASLLAKNSGLHPAQLRDAVTSPGGTTIAAIATMERGGLRSAISDGVVAAMKRTKELGKRSE